MAQVLAAVRHVGTSFHDQWPAAVIAFGIWATVAWNGFLVYLGIALVRRVI
jgi:hypothetical protein